MTKHRAGSRPGTRRLLLPVALLVLLLLTLLASPALASDDVAAKQQSWADLDAKEADIPWLWWIAPVGAVLAIGFAAFFYFAVKKADPGTEIMQGIAKNVTDGAMAYLRQQYKVLLIFFIVVAAILAFLAFVDHSQSKFVPFAFLTGGFFSGLCGFLGMKTATMASSRTSSACRDKESGLNAGLVVAFRAGAVMGLVVVGFGLIDICAWFLVLKYVGGSLMGYAMTMEEITVVMLCFGMGASSQALFARVGGGIYTKAADVGADLVGKIEAGIPEDDARNPATIADNVGDNVGDVAGMGADLYESYCGSILASAALGVAAIAALFTLSGAVFAERYWDDATGDVAAGAEAEFAVDEFVNDKITADRLAAKLDADAISAEVTTEERDAKLAAIVQAAEARLPLIGSWAEGMDDNLSNRDKVIHYAQAYKDPAFKLAWQTRLLALPMTMAGIGILLSILGIFMVRTREGATFKQLLQALSRPIWITSILLAGVTIVLVLLLFDGHYIGVALSVITGLFAGVWIGNRTEYFTSYDFKPTQGISKQAEYGPATVIIDGIATGMYSTIWPVITIVGAIILAYGFAGGFTHTELGLYGVGLAAVGMLSTLGYTLATDAYGPIADNAGGNAEMSGLEPTVRERTDALDSLGNTTAATGKGFAIGSAALTALALLAAYLEEVRTGLIRAAGAALDGTLGQGAFEHGRVSAEVLKTDGWHSSANEAVADLGLAFTQDGQVTMKLSSGALEPVKTATFERFTDFYHVNLMNPIVLVCIVLGAMLAFAFCAMTMKAVGRAAGAMVAEVRRQFRTIPGIMHYKPGDDSEENRKAEPEYASCVAIATKGAQREMILPSLVAVTAPVLAGLLFGVAGVIGLLAGGLAGGFLLAIMMANAGGAWDNAKKWIEQRKKVTIADVWSEDSETKAYVLKTGELLGFDFRERYRLGNPKRKLEEDVVKAIGMKGTVTLEQVWEDPKALKKLLDDYPEGWENRASAIVDGKASPAHTAGVIGDTVGDPFKDTSGPSLNILIKLMSMVSVVFAGVTAKWGAQILEAWTSLLKF